jgi:hypothetical protein
MGTNVATLQKIGRRLERLNANAWCKSCCHFQRRLFGLGCCELHRREVDPVWDVCGDHSFQDVKLRLKTEQTVAAYRREMEVLHHGN